MNKFNHIHRLMSAVIILTLILSGWMPYAVSALSGDNGIKRQVNAQTGRVSFIGPENGRTLSAAQALGTSPSKSYPADPALALARHFAPEFGIQNPDQDLKEMRRHESENGRLTVRYQQMYQGLPVMGGELIVNTNTDGDLYSMNGEVSQNLSLPIQPTIDSAQAAEISLAAMAKWYQQAPSDFTATEPELWIYDESLLRPSMRPVELVWRMEVTAKDIAMPLRELVLVNAQRGGISLHFNQVDTARGDAGNEQVRPATAYLPMFSASSWYVATSGNNSNSCSNAGSPCATIKAAIAKAAAGDTIYVATGTYTGSGAEVVLVNKSIALSGGWDAGFTTQDGYTTIEGQDARRGLTVNVGVTVTLDRFIVEHGNSRTTVSHRGGGIFNSGNLTINNSIIRNNQASSDGEGQTPAGGGISNDGSLILDHTTVSGNTAYSGGGIENSGSVILSHANISNNSTTNSAGGGINSRGSVSLAYTVVSHNSASIGGGINNSGTLTVTGSSIQQNRALNGRGGGIATGANSATISNTTIWGNLVLGSGGGISNSANGSLILNNATVSNNSASVGGGIDSSNSQTSALMNSILVGNTASSSGVDCVGTITSSGNNIISNTSGCTIDSAAGDQFNTDPLLGPFLPAQGYHALLPASPAINAGNPATCLPDDQRGVDRDDLCDIGAYEYLVPGTAASLLIFSGNDQTAARNHAFTDPLRVVILDSLGSPVPDVNVAFSAPGSGASGFFVSSGTTTTSVPTDSSGIATTSVFLANDQLGAFVVSASAGLLALNISLENLPSTLTYTANNTPSLPGTLLCDQSRRDCTHGSNPQADAAHGYATGTYNFYAAQFNRDGVDNNRMTIVSTVGYCDPNASCPYDNAFWSGTQIVYGSMHGWPLADDIVAHEFTHGVTQYESNLFYWYQSGAISESFSDLWGEYYDQVNGQGNDEAVVKWQIGEDVSGLGAFRNMKNPPQFKDPDKMLSSYYYKGEGDNGGVHRNSGVNNKAVYLMVEGGTFNSKTITALGWKKTAAIYYEANTNLLSSAADYSDLYFALQQACTNLIEDDGITAADCLEVKDAIEAVQMNAPLGTFAPEAPPCPTGMATAPSLVLFDDDLEGGTGNWSFNGSPNAWSLEEGYATSPTHMLYADDGYFNNDSSAALKGGILIPSGSSFLHFKHAYQFDNFIYQGTRYYFDGGVLEYSTDDGYTWKDAKPLFSAGLNYKGTIKNYSGTTNALKGRSAFVGDSHGYVSSRYDLSSLADQTVNFRWRLGTDESVAFLGWFIDDVRIYQCVGVPAIPILQAPANNVLFTAYTAPLLNWADAAPALDHYQVQVSAENTFAAPLYDAVVPVSEYQIPADLTPNTTYYWRVQSFNAVGSSRGWSAVRSFRAAILPPILTEPDPAVNLTYRRPLFNWENMEGATGYRIVISKYANLSSPIANVAVAASEFFPATDLPAKSVLYWRVQATGPNGPSQWSETRSFKTGNPPSAPLLVSPANNALLKVYTPTLKWGKSSLPSGTTFRRYELQVDDNNDFSSPEIGINTTDGIMTETSFTPPADLMPNMKYYWRVRAINDVAGEEHVSSWSKVWSFRTVMLPPVLLLPADGSTEVTLKPLFDWEEVVGATSYTIQISASPSFGTVLVSTKVNPSTFTPTTNLPKNKTLYWRVRANGPNGPSAWSVFQFTTPQ